MDIRVVLVSREGVERDAYLNAIKKLGVRVDTVTSFLGLEKLIIKTPCNGIMVDLITKIKATKQEKELAHELLELFPVVQLRREDKTGIIRTLYFGQCKGGGTIEDFINHECRSFKARGIRSSSRKNLNFNVLLSKNLVFSKKNIERTITTNISKGGCFIYSCEKWEKQSTAWFVIKELTDNTPILSEIKRYAPWGKAMQFPGIGLKYRDIKSGQFKELQDRFHI